MKIFIPEYIIFYETFYLNVYDEYHMTIMFFDYINYYDSLYYIKRRFVFFQTLYQHNIGYYIVYLKKQQWAYDFFWRRKLLRNDIFFKLIPHYYMPRKWLKVLFTYWEIPNCYKFHQYGYFNELVRDFYVNYHELISFKSEYPKYDCSLIFNHSSEQFDRKLIWLFERRQRGWVFFRDRPYRLELLLYNLRWIPGATELLLLNPNCFYFSSGNNITYARKWVYWTYHIYNWQRSRPFIVYGYWSSDFFFEIFKYRVLHYRYEFFRDSIVILGPIIGTTEVIKMYLYFFLRIFMDCVYIFWFTVVFAFFYSREKMVKLLILDVHLGNFSWLYAVIFNNIVMVERMVHLRRMRVLKKYKIRIERKSQVQSKLFKLIKKYIYLPLVYWYFWNMLHTNNYRNKIENNFLGSISNYNTYESYIYVLLIIVNIPFRFFSTFKTTFYKIHMNYYYKYNRIFKYAKFYNAKSNYSFNRFFSTRVIHIREVEKYGAYDIIERIINYIDIYMKPAFKDMAKDYIDYVYRMRMSIGSSRRREELWDFYFYRTFGNYDPELEFYDLQKARFFTRLWYYGTDFSFDLLTTHQLYLFFNYIHSPLFVRHNSTSLFNFYYLLFYSKGFYYYYYCGYFFFAEKFNVFVFYINYSFLIFLSLFRILKQIIDFFFDGYSWMLIKYYWWAYLFSFFSWLRKRYFFVNYIVVIFWIIYIFFHYLITIIYINLKLLFLFIIKSIYAFFSHICNTDLGRGYSFWHRYYMIKFYCIEYNIFYNIFIFMKNFFFNFFLICLVIFVLTTIPYVKELFLSDYLIHNLYLFINQLFEYNKFIYFNEVLDNWWVPYFSPQKFINFYNGYCDYFEFKLKKMFNRFYVHTAHLGGVRRYPYNKFFFEVYFKNYLYYLQWNKLNYLFELCRSIIPSSFPWELYFYMHGYFILVRHPAKHFMPDIYWNTLPIMWTFVWRYKYFLIISKIFVPLYWFWKYSFSSLVFHSLIYFNDTIFFSFVLNFYNNIYNFYYKLNYNIFYFCYYYYYYFFFMLSKFMRYYFVSYDILYYFWVYRSARFIILVDLFNFIRFLLDSFYFFIIEFFYGFFYYIYKFIYNLLDFLGLISFYNYTLFSLNFIPKIHLFISEWFNHFISLNYELNEYGQILSKHFRGRTRPRIGDWIRRDMAVHSVYKFIHRTVSFEFKFRQFLFYMNKDLMKNFLIYNKIKLNNFNLFFFSFISLYLNFILLLLIFCFFSLKLRKFFKTDIILSASPFFEWERFTIKNRHLVQRDEFYWMYNIRWLRKFEFYIDKYFSDDLYMRLFNNNEVRFGYYLYNQWNKFFVYHEDRLKATMQHNRFLFYKRYYLERYISIIKDIDFLFHTYSISNKLVQGSVYDFYNLFIPWTLKKSDFNFKKDFFHGYGHMDYYWFYFATPQLMYTRNWNFMRVMTREKESKEFYAKLKKSLFKAYSLYEMNRKTLFYDFFEFQFFEPEFYDDVLFENAGAHNASEKNYFLHRIALSRWNTELVYVTPGKSYTEMYTNVGYSDWIQRLEYYYNNLRIINSNYFNNFIDFGLFSFIMPLHPIYTHMDAETVKDSIDLSVNDNAIGIKYSELYQFEDLGRVATEQYLHELVDKVFLPSAEDPTVRIVSLTDDMSLTHRHTNLWTVLTLFLPIIMVCVLFEEYIYFTRYVGPHLGIREFIGTVFPRILGQLDSDIILFHRLLTMEHFDSPYWFNPWTYIRTWAYDLHRLDNYSFWEGKHAHFLQSKNEFLWIYSLLMHDDYRYDNISFLLWNFYIEAWKQCWETVIIFVSFEFFIYFLYILFFLFIFNFYLLFKDYYHFISNKVFIVLDDTNNIDAYKNYEERMKLQREKKKKKQFDFVDLEGLTKVKGAFSSHKRDSKYKKL